MYHFPVPPGTPESIQHPTIAREDKLKRIWYAMAEYRAELTKSAQPPPETTRSRSWWSRPQYH